MRTWSEFAHGTGPADRRTVRTQLCFFGARDVDIIVGEVEFVDSQANHQKGDGADTDDDPEKDFSHKGILADFAILFTFYLQKTKGLIRRA